MSLCFPAKDRCDTALEYAINKLQFVGFNCCHAPERPRRFRMQLNPRLGELAMCLTAMAAGVYNLMTLLSHVTSVFKAVSRNLEAVANGIQRATCRTTSSLTCVVDHIWFLKIKTAMVTHERTM